MADNTRKLFPLRMTEREHAEIELAARSARTSMNAYILNAVFRKIAEEMGMSYLEHFRRLDEDNKR